LIRQKKREWKQVKFLNTGERLEEYKKLEKMVSKKIRNAKRKLERELAFGNDKSGKQFSTYVKSKTKTRTGIGPLKMADGSVTADNKLMAQRLNEYFSSVFSKENLANVPTKQRETNVDLEHIIFERPDVLKVLKNLKQGAAPGPDGISPKILRELRFEIVGPLINIFQKSLDQTTVPRDWKLATVTPIYKKGQKSDAANYRPVSLTSIPCKIMETVIKNKLMTHLLDQDLIKPSQHGFMPGRSCVTNLILFLDELTKAVDNGIPADVFYLDFSKAFDKVPRERLIIKLEAKGVTGRLKTWIGNWLTGRTQRVVINGESSESSEVDSGVPQGTVLGPPLFTIHIDDIDDFMRLIELLKKFADDTKGLKFIQGLADRESLQRTLDLLCKWAENWGMSFNVDKCKIMHVGRTNPQYEYKMNDKVLKAVEVETDVGVLVQNSLKPGKQCQKAANVATGVLKTIWRNFSYRDKKVYMNLYKQYVRPHLEFSVSAWAPWQEGDKAVLERVQEKAINAISGMAGLNYEEKCRQLNIETLEMRREQQDLVLTYKILNGIGNIDYSGLFTKIQRTGARTRLAAGYDNLIMPQARTEVRRNSFAVRVVPKWNRLPDEIKQSRSVEEFKRKIKNFYKGPV
jgi:hypothetical protein